MQKAAYTEDGKLGSAKNARRGICTKRQSCVCWKFTITFAGSWGSTAVEFGGCDIPMVSDMNWPILALALAMSVGLAPLSQPTDGSQSIASSPIPSRAVFMSAKCSPLQKASPLTSTEAKRVRRKFARTVGINAGYTKR